MRETVIENSGIEYGEARGWLARKISYPGRRGAPDHHFYRRGVLLIVEFKKRGEGPSVHQEREHARLRSHGFEVHVIDEHNLSVLKAMFDGLPVTGTASSLSDSSMRALK